MFEYWDDKAQRKSPGFWCKIFGCKPIKDSRLSYRGHCSRCGFKPQ